MENEEEIQSGIPVKIIILGSINVGKTSLVTRYATGKFQDKTKSTKNASFINRTKKVNGIKYDLKVWDTAGQEKFKCLTKIFIKDANIAILVYSIDNQQSFEELREWYKVARGCNNENLIIGIAANKSDLKSDTTVPEDEGKKYASNIGAIWKSTSALLENCGIEELVDDLFIKLLSTGTLQNEEESSSSLNISSENSLDLNESKSSCCGGGKKNKTFKSSKKIKKTKRKKKTHENEE